MGITLMQTFLLPRRDRNPPRQVSSMDARLGIGEVAWVQFVISGEEGNPAPSMLSLATTKEDVVRMVTELLSSVGDPLDPLTRAALQAKLDATVGGSDVR